MENVKRELLAPGKRIGPCEVVELIGHGGMGDVYRANHLALSKSVALKILAQPWAQQAEHVEGFLREAKLASRLEDEHIVQICDVGSDAGYHFIVMQLAKMDLGRGATVIGRHTMRVKLEIIDQFIKLGIITHSETVDALREMISAVRHVAPRRNMITHGGWAANTNTGEMTPFLFKYVHKVHEQSDFDLDELTEDMESAFQLSGRCLNLVIQERPAQQASSPDKSS